MVLLLTVMCNSLVLFSVRGWPVFHFKAVSEFCQLWPQTPLAFFRHLWHSSDTFSILQTPLAFFVLRPPPSSSWSTSYSKPLPAFPNATTCSFHSDPLPDNPSKGCSETSTSSKGNPETSLDSAPSDLNSALTFFGDSLSHSGDRVTPVASDIKGRVIKVVCDMNGWWWSESMGNARQWPWS